VIGNVNAWVPLNPSEVPFRSDEHIRASQSVSDRVASYKAITRQLDVSSNPRYKRGHNNDPKDGEETYCNIYLCDFMWCMGVVLPHWVDPATGAPVGMGKGVETSANGICKWIFDHGMMYHWMECSQAKARERASSGWPTACFWLNPKGIGHVVVVMPGMEFTHISQAGATNYYDVPLQKGYGGIPGLRFFTHD
jgi:hypothetical protein